MFILQKLNYSCCCQNMNNLYDKWIEFWVSTTELASLSLQKSTFTSCRYFYWTVLIAQVILYPIIIIIYCPTRVWSSADKESADGHKDIANRLMFTWLACLLYWPPQRCPIDFFFSCLHSLSLKETASWGSNYSILYSFLFLMEDFPGCFLHQTGDYLKQQQSIFEKLF